MCNIKNRIKIVINIIYGILMVVVVAIPLYLCVINSFKQNQSMFLDFFCIPETFDLSNFRYIFIKKHILRYMFNSFYITTIVVGIISIINPFIAYKISINWDNKKYRAIYFCISSAMFIPSQFIIFPLIRIFYKLNLMNPIGLIVYYSIFMIPECVFMLVPFFKFFKKI